eukprot:m.10963 g.10963  ORF g.10963 m.10963 type:complete len:246 (+) comp8569_c0_seq1:186-923(+)
MLRAGLHIFQSSKRSTPDLFAIASRPISSSTTELSWKRPKSKDDPNYATHQGKHGEIQLIIGPMFSGKSTEMLRRLKRYEHALRPCFAIKHADDSRFSDKNASANYISTHDAVNVRLASRTPNLFAMKESIANVDVVAIDEGQFFPDLVPFCEYAANQGKVVIVAALDGNFLREPFQNVCDLIPRSESVTKINAICAVCGEPASFSKRTVADQTVKLVGGSDMYKPVCRLHHRSEETSADNETHN